MTEANRWGRKWKEINSPKGSCYWDVCAKNLLPVSTSHLLVLPKGSFCSTTATNSPSCKSISNSCVALHLRLAWYSSSVLYVDSSLDLSASVWRGDSSWKEKNYSLGIMLKPFLEQHRCIKGTSVYCMWQLTTFLHTDQGVSYTAIGNQISFAYAARVCPTVILIADQ